MLYQLKNKGENQKIRKTNLKNIGWKERDLEKMLVENTDDFISGNVLMPIFRQRLGQEEPDIMALDEKGNLYIFELKRWSGQEENLLQVLRYGQIFGNSTYDDLEVMYLKFVNRNDVKLNRLHQEYFGLSEKLEEKNFNKEQHFIVVTNGMDQRTMDAIEYWRKQGIKIDALIYWVYEIDGNYYMEIDRYMPDESGLEYETQDYILNTNASNDSRSHDEMLERKIAAAYVSGWKEKIDNLQVNDRVFLYKSGEGIVATGTVSSKRKKEEWQGNPDDKYFVELTNFKNIAENPITPARMRELKGGGYSFRTTLYSIDEETSSKLMNEINSTLKGV